MKIIFEEIGIIKTPYKDIAPFRPDPEAKGDFYILIHKEYQTALQDLAKFSHMLVLFHFNRATKTNLKAHPPHMGGLETGLFASRSPNRINKIGMDILKIISIEDNVIRTSPMDILDNTPVLDIKPYIPDLDCHPEASTWHI